MRFDDAIQACIAAREDGDGVKMTLAELNVLDAASVMHRTFWSEYRLQKWLDVMEEPYAVPSWSSRVGQAVFPVYVTSTLSLLYRVVITTNTVGYHRVRSDLIVEKEYLLEILKTSVNPSKGFVDVTIALEPEYKEIGQKSQTTPIKGKSFGLAVRVAVESFNLGELIGGRSDDGFVFTGEVHGRQIDQIDRLQEKSDSLQEWRHQSILLSPQQVGFRAPNVKGCTTIDEVFEALQESTTSWRKRYLAIRNVDSDRVVQQSLNWLEDLQQLPMDTPEVKFDTGNKLRILLKVIPAYNHLGRAMETMPLCAALVQFFKDAPCRKAFQKLLCKGDENWHMLFANCAVSFLDDFKVDEGLELYDLELEAAFDEQRLIHYQGSKASLLIAKGEFEAAKELYEENLQLSRENLGDDAGTELVRTLCYYGNLLRIMKLYEASEKAFLEAKDKAGIPMYDGNDSLPWIEWQYAKLLHDMNREEELPARLDGLRDFAAAAIQRAYPKSQSDIDVGLAYLAKNQNTMSKLYQSAKFRAEAQLQKYTTGAVDAETLDALRELHPDWATLTYPELLQRIPY